MTSADDPPYGVWADVAGQARAASVLARAAEGQAHAMSHAWLITGPPGSGRSNAARAFAAALQCVHQPVRRSAGEHQPVRRLAGDETTDSDSAPASRPGCGTCADCRTALSGAHLDVTLVRTEQLSIGVDEVRDLVRKASMSPTRGKWQVLIVEDADRMTERAADALLKSVEEPASATVWMLCAPSADAVVATIRSRCRRLNLTTPSVAAIEQVLVQRDGADPGLAALAARASQGHIGRARALVSYASSRERREQVLAIPSRLRDVGSCLQVAAEIVQAASAEASTVTATMDERESGELSQAMGSTTKGAKPRHAQAALRALTDSHRARHKRYQRDALDQVLSELTAYYRDALVLQIGSKTELINAQLGEQLNQYAADATPNQTLQRIDALLACRTALDNNVAPLLAFEALLLELFQPSGEVSGLRRPKAIKLRR